jgi:hypothetical protein
MKTNFLNVFIVLSLFFLVSCGGGMKSKVVGSWELVKLKGEAIGDNLKGATLTFSKDGTFEQSAAGQTRKGKYEVDEKAKTITLKPEEGKEETITEVKVEKDMLSGKNDNEVAEFKKKK